MAQNGSDGLEQTKVEGLKVRPGCVVQQPRPQGMKLPSPAGMISSKMSQRHGKWSQGTQRKNQTNWASAKPVMQAIFLGPSPRTNGTGVFIPQAQLYNRRPIKKPASSPVLVPARVVQSLNLNVHEVGNNTKPQPEESKNNGKKEDQKMEHNKKENGIYISPDIFLPEEWTY